MPPRGIAEWEAEFARYKASPEFKLLNPRMTLEEYKRIYWMEWTHRLWGRLVGVSFVVPLAYFLVRRQIAPRDLRKILPIGGLIALQGFLGWWMVKSGLRDELLAPGSHPRVSQYRLVAHLGTAFLTYGAMLSTGFGILQRYTIVRDPAAATSLFRKFNVDRSPHLLPFMRGVTAVAALVFCTAMSGGLVAGLDAGMIYNDFPYMGDGHFIPPPSELFSDFYARKPDKSDIWWRNMLENPSLVQLEHRILAGTTFASVVALGMYAKRTGVLRAPALQTSRIALRAVVGVACLQVTLGITTLMYLVPIPLASAHQAGSLALLTSLLFLRSRYFRGKFLTQKVNAYNGWVKSQASKRALQTRH